MASAKEVSRFKSTLEENIKTYIELRRSSWSEVMCMPYDFFISDLKWKIKLEDEKRKRLEEHSKQSSDKAHKALVNKNK